MKKLRQKIFKLNCVTCNQTYETTSSWGKYCSNACKQKSFRQRRDNNKERMVTELHNIVAVLRNNNVVDNCKECNKPRTLLEQMINRTCCFDCFAPNYTIINSIKEGYYNDFLDDPLVVSVKNGEWDSFLEKSK